MQSIYFYVRNTGDYNSMKNLCGWKGYNVIDNKYKLINSSTYNNFNFKKGDIVFIFRYYKFPMLYKKKNVKYIWEPIDNYYKKGGNSLSTLDWYINRIISHLNQFDLILLPSKHILNLVKNKKNSSKFNYIYHEYDSRIIKTGKRIDRVAYYGSLLKTSLKESDLKNYKINTSPYIDDIDYSALYSHLHNSEIHIDFFNDTNCAFYHMKCTSKLTFCLKTGSIFICNKMPIYLEILGEKYQFYLNEDLSNIKDVINKAKLTINNDSKYLQYIDEMSEIYKILSPKNILNQYEEIASKI